MPTMSPDEIDTMIFDTLAKYGGPMGWGEGVRDAEKSDQLGEQRQALIDRILGMAQGSSDEQKKFIAEQVLPELDKLRGAAGTAADTDKEALAKLGAAGSNVRDIYNRIAKDTGKTANKFNNMSGDLWDQLKSSYGELNDSDRAALEKYIGETDPLMQQLKAGGWGEDVKADAESLEAQRNALGKSEGLTDTEATAQERFLNEMARRNFEQQDRGNREAVMQDLKQRGLNSGTLQIAQNLAAQERLGQERTQAELGLQAGAVQRAMQGLEMYGGQANTMRSAADAISEFNKSGSQVAQRFQDQYAQEEAQRVGNLAGQRQQTTQSTNEALGGRAKDIESSGQQMLDTNYGREQDVYDAQREAGDVGYDTQKEEAGAMSEAGQRQFTNQGAVLGGATGVAGVEAGANDPNVPIDALKVALGETDLEEGKVKAS